MLAGAASAQTLTTNNLQVNGAATLSTALAFASGGTGATTQAAALTNILGASTVPLANGGTNAATAAGAVANLGLRAQQSVAATLYVDNSAGSDWAGCGTGTGANACRSIQTAYNNVAQYNDWRGVVPIIKLTSGQTYTSGLTIQQGAQTSPFVAGVNQLVLDLNGATINVTNGSDIYIRHVPIWLRVMSSSGQGTLTVSGTSGQLVDARGGGVMVEFDGHITFGAVPSPYPQIEASRAAQVTTCPVGTCSESTGYVISGGGGYFLQALLGGSVQFEGVSIAINAGITYTQAFLDADTNGSTNLNGLTWTGSNVTGPQYIASKNGTVNTNAQTGSFTACPGNGYVPGSVCGQMGYIGGRFSDPGLPTVSGCGTGAVVQNSEPGFSVVLGSGLPTTNGATVNSCVITMATRSNWNGWGHGENDTGSVANLGGQWTGPTGTAPGTLQLIWKGTGYDPNGKVVWVTMGE
ncbi:hypothetical protein D7207_01700 [Burkholderia cepacia]|nr:hypothetical protein [Burkholderia cepacia]MBA9990678.1 hypothetical protein [Burkholderia cepacia]MBB0014543.1 hypothetical protein [Burkholderia cepacia]MBB0050773.1 hypothetical protein [Burkholderia cepacia]MBB0051224.1 hypothetical protein [Burkholderia cepacia]